MALLGIDVGTTGCKVAAFAEDGALLAESYREYDIDRTAPGYSQLDAAAVWNRIRDAIAETAARASDDPVRAISVTSMGEAVVPVSKSRDILGPSILNDDVRGEEFIPELQTIDPERLYAINGNTLGNHFTASKLMWLKKHDPATYERTDCFLNWAPFVLFMLGAEPRVDFSLANRTMLFDLNAKTWSGDLLEATGLHIEKLPEPVQAGEIVGVLDSSRARELKLRPGAMLVAGGHDQCVNCVGAGVTHQGDAMLGLGTYHCILPPFLNRPATKVMLERGLNTEHHVLPGQWATFLYNQGGSYMKWYRDTFALAEHRAAERQGASVYPRLADELPDGPSGLLVLPHFAPTGPPDFISDSCGAVIGLGLATTRGAILKGLWESIAFSLRQNVETLPKEIQFRSLRVVGGGSKSDAWAQLYADILGMPLTRTAQPDAGALGAAMLAGAAAGVYASLDDAASTVARTQRTFEPNPRSVKQYEPWYERFTNLWPRISACTRDVASLQHRRT